MQNNSRHVIALLKELCGERGIRLVSFCDDWVHRLEKGVTVTHVFGYDFAINSSTSRMLAKDKAATSALLQYAGIPNVEHRLFHAPTMAEYVPHTGNWSDMLQYFYTHDRRLVCKPNEGTGGADVFRVLSEIELEAAVHKIFQRHRSLCLSPLIEGAKELRFIIVNSTCEVAYEKVRPYVVADGISTVAKLVAGNDELAMTLNLRDGLASGTNPIDWNMIPKEGECVLLSWHHNLGRGAKFALLSEYQERFSEFRDLAIRACDALQLRAASVDLFATPDASLVLEINAGIMMENLSSQGSEARAAAKRIYAKILDSVIS